MSQAGRIRNQGWVWGLIDQASSSATNFLLTVVSARLLGERGLGAVFIAFTCYLLVLGFQRALVTEPLTTSSALLPEDERQMARTMAVQSIVRFSAIVSICMVAVSVFFPQEIREALRTLGLLLIPLLIQDCWRSILFRDGRGKAAALNDATWLILMVITVPLLMVRPSVSNAILWWGTAGSGASLIGYIQVGRARKKGGNYREWLGTSAWPLGKWLLAESALFSLGSYAIIFSIAFFVGTEGVGGLRAVQSLFAPLTVIGPALTLPGLPLMVRTASLSPIAGRRLAMKIGGIAAGAVLLFLLLLLVAGPGVLGAVFGQSFSRHHALLLPVGLGQIAGALGLGFPLFLKATLRGRDLLLARAVGSGAVLVLGSIMAVAGLQQAAWGMAIGLLLGLVALILASRVGPLEPALGSGGL